MVKSRERERERETTKSTPTLLRMVTICGNVLERSIWSFSKMDLKKPKLIVGWGLFATVTNFKGSFYILGYFIL